MSKRTIEDFVSFYREQVRKASQEPLPENQERGFGVTEEDLVMVLDALEALDS